MSRAGLLLICTIILPINGQQKSTQTATKTSQTKQEVVTPAPKATPNAAINQQTPQIQEDGPKEHAQSYFSRLFAPENLPNIGLFLVGIAGIGVAIRTLKAIERQTQALVDSQRARIAAKAHGIPTQTLLDRDAPRVEIELFNRGRTEASDFIYESWIEVLPFPFEDFTPVADRFRSPEKLTLYPDHIPLVINIPIRQGLSEQQLHDLKKLRSFACVRVRVEYRDAFNPKRWAEFGFYITSSGLGFLPKYNNSN